MVRICASSLTDFVAPTLGRIWVIAWFKFPTTVVSPREVTLVPATALVPPGALVAPTVLVALAGAAGGLLVCPRASWTAIAASAVTVIYK